jgi:hypothetical protein
MLAIPADINWGFVLPQMRSLVMPRRMGWRDHIATGLILLAQKVVGYASEEDFARAARSIHFTERDVGSNRVPGAEAPVFGGFDFYFGKTSGAIAKAATNGTLTIWDSSTDATAVAATSSTLSNIYNPFADVGATKFALVIQLPWTLMLCAAEC